MRRAAATAPVANEFTAFAAALLCLDPDERARPRRALEDDYLAPLFPFRAAFED